MKVIELPKPKPAESLLELLDDLRAKVEAGQIKSVVVLCADGHNGDFEFAYAEGGFVEFGPVLYNFELWTKNAIYHG